VPKETLIYNLIIVPKDFGYSGLFVWSELQNDTALQCKITPAVPVAQPSAAVHYPVVQEVPIALGWNRLNRTHELSWQLAGSQPCAAASFRIRSTLRV